jgi:phosphocarrier protein
MVSQKVIVRNQAGFHLRPAGILCKEALKYESRITFKFNNQVHNAKSVLGVLGAGISSGSELEFVCEGKDEQDALNAMIMLIENGLGD